MNTYPDDCVEASDWKQVTHAEDQYKFHPMNHYSLNADYREVAKRINVAFHPYILPLSCDGWLWFFNAFRKWPWC